MPCEPNGLYGRAYNIFITRTDEIIQLTDIASSDYLASQALIQQVFQPKS